MSMVENPKKGHLGLANLGNTCYLNSALQALRHVPDLSVFMNKHSDSWINVKPGNKEAALCNAYKEVVVGLWSGSGPGYMKPSKFVNIFRESLKECPTYEHMVAPIQHDSGEALTFLLDQLHEGMKRPLNFNVIAEKDSPTYNALIAWKEQVAPNYSPIVDYFFGLMEVSITCKGCSNIRCRYEPFNMLKVGFPDQKSATLEECIDYEFQPEEIDEYQCDLCSPDVAKGSDQVKNKRPPGSVQRRIWRLPQNLIIVLKRFNHNGTKCNAEFNAKSSNVFTKWFSNNSPESSKTSNYSIQSTIDHQGSHPNGGHYVAQIKSPLTGKWNIYDDENVGQILDGSKAQLGRHSYVLFLRKQ